MTGPPTRFGALLGGTAGSLLPALWGGSLLSLASLGLSVVGGIAGVLLAARLGSFG